MKHLYKIDKTTLALTPFNIFKHHSYVGLVVLTTFLFISFHVPVKTEYIDTEMEIIIKNKQHEFSEALLIEEIKKYNFRFPDIILAQAIIESGYNSPIFKDNHNLFGMKEAKVRMNVAQGTNRAHAMYGNWRMSVMDRALYEESYLRKIKDRAQYLNYLDNFYAEAQNYDKAIERVIGKRKLKGKFNGSN